MKAERTERGWAGHFICADRCLFRRNTLLEYEGIKIVISTVGLLQLAEEKDFETLGSGRYYETMAFHSDYTDVRYYDADVSKQIYFFSDWALNEIDADDKANVMHEQVVEEITKELKNGNKF